MQSSDCKTPCMRMLKQRYCLIREIGSGGTGKVYYGIDTVSQSPIAIKHLKDAYTTPDMISRLQQEAKLLRILKHPNIVSLYDFLEEDQQLFLIMAYIKDGSLRSLLNSRLLSIQQVIAFCRDIIAAIAFSHQHGVIHRDIKPDNILIDNRLYLSDFGVAYYKCNPKFFDPMIICGTPAYLAPEALDGVCSELTDIWSFGIMIYEMLTGQHPFDIKNLSALVDIVRKPVPPVTNLNPEIPEELANLVHQLLNQNPAKRPQSATEIDARLKEIQQEVMLTGS